jgi:hypothetical protein
LTLSKKCRVYMTSGCYSGELLIMLGLKPFSARKAVDMTIS